MSTKRDADKDEIQSNSDEAAAAARAQELVYAAMMADLGVGRLNALPLADSGPVPEEVVLPQAPRQLNAHWANANILPIDPPSAGLDSLHAGQLYRQRRAAVGGTNPEQSSRNERSEQNNKDYNGKNGYQGQRSSNGGKGSRSTRRNNDAGVSREDKAVEWLRGLKSSRDSSFEEQWGHRGTNRNKTDGGLQYGNKRASAASSAGMANTNLGFLTNGKQQAATTSTSRQLPNDQSKRIDNPFTSLEKQKSGGHCEVKNSYGGDLKNSRWATFQPPAKTTITQAAVLRASGESLFKKNDLKKRADADRSIAGTGVVLDNNSTHDTNTAIKTGTDEPTSERLVSLDPLLKPLDEKDIRGRWIRLRRLGITSNVMYRLFEDPSTGFRTLQCTGEDGNMVIDDVVSTVTTAQVVFANRNEVIYCACFDDNQPIWWFVFNLAHEADSFVKLVLPGVDGGRNLIREKSKPKQAPEVTNPTDQLLIEISDETKEGKEANGKLHDLPLNRHISNSLLQELTNVNQGSPDLIELEESETAPKTVPEFRSALMDLAPLCVSMIDEVFEKMNENEDGSGNLLERVLKISSNVHAASTDIDFLSSGDVMDAVQWQVRKFFQNSMIFSLLNEQEQYAFCVEVAPKLLEKALEARNSAVGGMYTIGDLLDLRHTALPVSALSFVPSNRNEQCFDTAKGIPSWTASNGALSNDKMSGSVVVDDKDVQLAHQSGERATARGPLTDMITAAVMQGSGVDDIKLATPCTGRVRHNPSDSDVERLRIELKAFSVTDDGTNKSKMVQMDDVDVNSKEVELHLPKATGVTQSAGIADIGTEPKALETTLSGSGKDKESIERMKRGLKALSCSRFASEPDDHSKSFVKAAKYAHPLSIPGAADITSGQRAYSDAMIGPPNSQAEMVRVLVQNSQTGLWESIVGFREHQYVPLLSQPDIARPVLSQIENVSNSTYLRDQFVYHGVGTHGDQSRENLHPGATTTGSGQKHYLDSRD